MPSKIEKYEVAVLGGGITGSSIFYVLSKYTDIESAVLIEKCAELGQINSSEKNNSQTLHFGDIETNYSFEKAAKTNEASEMVSAYLKSAERGSAKIFSKSHKMALAVGEKEVAELEKRYEELKKIFPDLKKIYKKEIGKIEPNIVLGRKENEKIAALYSDNSIVVDFGALAEDFALKGEKNREDFKIKLGTKVVSISKVEGGYEISTDKGTVFAEKIVVAMCSHSLMFAKKMGYGKDFSILPVGGNYYTSQKKVLNGKVYTMQSGKLPFAAIHGDPNVHNEDETRFGPTANIMPFLERNNFSTLWDFVRSSVNDTKSFIALLQVVTDRLLFGFLLRSFVYAVPLAGTMAFVGLSRKIVPTLEYADFKKGRTKAGIRPQLVDNRTGKLVMGEAEIIGEDMIFHISPSPGATVCLSNAAKTVDKLMEFFEGKRVFDEELFKKDLSSK